MEKHSSRSKNFSTSEVNLLVRLVDSNKKVVESKKTGAVTNREKGKMWEKIALSFNSQTTEGINREAKVLKEKWTNLKRVAVKNHAADKKFRQGTGGGPSKPAQETPTDTLVNNILGTRLTGLEAECDSDALPVPSMSEHENIYKSAWDTYEDSDAFDISILENNGSEIDEENTREGAGNDSSNNLNESSSSCLKTKTFKATNLESPSLPKKKKQKLDLITEQVTEDAENNWGDYNTKMLKRPASSPLHVKTLKGKHKITGTMTNEKWCRLAERKQELAELKIQQLRQEHEQKKEVHELMLKHLEEEHVQKLEFNQELHSLKLKFLQEEQEIKLKLLQEK